MAAPLLPLGMSAAKAVDIDMAINAAMEAMELPLDEMDMVCAPENEKISVAVCHVFKNVAAPGKKTAWG